MQEDRGHGGHSGLQFSREIRLLHIVHLEDDRVAGIRNFELQPKFVALVMSCS